MSNYSKYFSSPTLTQTKSGHRDHFLLDPHT